MFLLGYIPFYIIVVYIANLLFLTVAECPGGGCAEVTIVEWIFFGTIVFVFLIIGVIVYLYLKKK